MQKYKYLALVSAVRVVIRSLVLHTFQKRQRDKETKTHTPIEAQKHMCVFFPMERRVKRRLKKGSLVLASLKWCEGRS